MNWDQLQNFVLDWITLSSFLCLFRNSWSFKSQTHDVQGKKCYLVRVRIFFSKTLSCFFFFLRSKSNLPHPHQEPFVTNWHWPRSAMAPKNTSFHGHHGQPALCPSCKTVFPKGILFAQCSARQGKNNPPASQETITSNSQSSNSEHETHAEYEWKSLFTFFLETVSYAKKINSKDTRGFQTSKLYLNIITTDSFSTW